MTDNDDDIESLAEDSEEWKMTLHGHQTAHVNFFTNLVEENDVKAVKLLLKRGLNDANEEDRYEWCPLDLCKSTPMLRVLLKYGAVVDPFTLAYKFDADDNQVDIRTWMKILAPRLTLKQLTFSFAECLGFHDHTHHLFATRLYLKYGSHAFLSDNGPEHSAYENAEDPKAKALMCRVHALGLLVHRFPRQKDTLWRNLRDYL